MSEGNDQDQMRADYSGALKGGVRGKFFERATGRVLFIELDEDLRKLFPDSKSINEGLRELIGYKRSANKI